MKLGANQFLTSSGRVLDVLRPEPEKIVIEDIAHAMSMICRFGGHLRGHYSVASHSVHVSRLVPDSLAAAGLIHDASEAYICDVIRPVKRQLRDYAVLEAGWMLAICRALGVSPIEVASPEIHFADLTALATEMRDLATWPGGTCPDPDGAMPDFGALHYVAAPVAEKDFLQRWAEVRS